MATYIYRSAKTGKIVTEKYAKANPDSVVKEKVKEPRKPRIKQVVEAVHEAITEVTGLESVPFLAVPNPPPEVAPQKPAPGFFRVYGHIIEATPKGNIKHWRVDNVHCTEATDMTVEEGEPMTKQEIYEELH